MPTRTVHHDLRLLRRRLLVQGRAAGRRGRPDGPGQGRWRQRGPLLRQGPLRVRLRHAPGPRAHAADARVDRRRVARGRPGTRRSPSSQGDSARSRTSTAPARSAASPRRGCTNEEVYVVQKMVRGGLRQQQRRHLRAGLPLADRLRPQADLRHLGRHPGLRVRSTSADVIVVIGANPTDGHPVFASRMKKRLREGAEADRRRPAPDRPGPHAAHRGRSTTCQLAPAPTSRSSTRWRTSWSPRAWCDRRVRRRALRGLRRVGRRSSPGRRTAPRRSRRSPACPAERAARRRPAVRRRRRNAAIYYGLGVTEHSQGSTMVMGMANLAMATGNIGRERRRRQPAARPEQRAGLLRHGLVPARAARLPARLRPGRARDLRAAVGHADPDASRACASPTCSTPRSTAPSGRCSSRARTSPSPTRTPSTCTPRWRRWTCSSCRTCSSTRPRSSRTCCCPARRSSRRTAPSPTPSAGSTGSAR